MKLELEDIQAKAKAAHAIVEIMKQPITIQAQAEMRKHILMLDEEVVLPLNCMRFWTALKGQTILVTKRYDAFAQLMAYWRPMQEKPMDDQTSTPFDMTEPHMWKVMVTADNEATLEDDVPEKPTLPCQLRAWEIERCYDRCNRNFTTWYCNAWANDHVLNLLTEGVTLPYQLMQAWAVRLPNEQ